MFNGSMSLEVILRKDEVKRFLEEYSDRFGEGVGRY